jgi:hypothetical protein
MQRSFNTSFSYQNPLAEKFSPEFFQEIPTEPGVYFMRDEEGEILYIGKAKSLKARLSSYRNAKPGQVGENIVELLEHVTKIHWELHPTENAAVLRERELLHAVRPPYNIAEAWPEEYLFIGIREDEGKIHFRLTRREGEKGYKFFGCFKQRRKVKNGYTALLRLLYAATNQKPRFSYPAKIARVSPPYLYSTTLPHAWHKPLEKLLSGQSTELLELIVSALLQNESLPAFMYPSIQEDLGIVQDFFKHCPQETRRIVSTHGLRTRVVSHRAMERAIKATV